MRHTLAVVALLCAGMLLSACASGGGQAKEKVAAIDSIQSVVEQLGKGRGQIDAVVASIDKLQAGGDLQAAFKTFNASVADVQSTNAKIVSRREDMQENRKAYIAKWQADLESIDNADVKAALAERQKMVSANFDQIAKAMADVREAYQPFMKDVTEIQKGLSLDLNAAGVAALKKPLDDAKAAATNLKAKVAALESELTAIAGSMTPTPAPK